MFTSFDQPEFVDNRSGNTLAAAFITYLQGLDRNLAADTTLELVTGYFAIDDGLERVEHFLAAATNRGVFREAMAGATDAVVGAIGPPTAETAADCGPTAAVAPEVADFEALATRVVEAATG